MKTVILSPTEHADASNEEHTVYSLAEQKDRFTTLDQFFFATVATDAYPKDERWYRKRPATADEISKRLRESGIKEVQSIESASVLEAYITVDDVMEFDCHLSSRIGYLRFLSYSTA
jgi:hypothetical protein